MVGAIHDFAAGLKRTGLLMMNVMTEKSNRTMKALSCVQDRSLHFVVVVLTFHLGSSAGAPSENIEQTSATVIFRQ